ncbi:uncharacterized protein LOC124898518 [Capsicum annuum]|uniref:uncharacterized protein LOC124898518 n=1 Tax=Capsicum annuum TaxID=4072 RepID=UPI001FB0B6EB|nr:uncharacterized protein LOC124898518 [Capsicum annuum]
MEQKDWSKKQDDALWASRTAYKTSIRTYQYRLVYGKAYHFPVELKHQAYFEVKKLNLDIKTVGEKRLLKLNELDDFHLHAYKNTRLYKENTKKWHDKQILNRVFEPGQLVLLFNSRLKLFPGRLCSKWFGPFKLVRMMPYGAFELWNKEKTEKFLVKGKWMKHYWADHAYQHNVSITFVDE